MNRTIGILGGMGPMATLLFEQKLLSKVSASDDQAYPIVITINDGTTPDRTDYLLGNGQSPVSNLQMRLAQLELCGSDVVCIPCNTAHAPDIIDELERASRVPILNMPEEVCRALSEQVSVIGVLATNGSIAAGVYQTAALQSRNWRRENT